MSDRWDTFDVAVARWRLRDMAAERLPGAAMRALEAGCHARSLAQLAVMQGASWSEIEPVVLRVLDERGRRLPTIRSALKVVADDVLRLMVSGDVAPEKGVERLRLLSTAYGVESEDFGTFCHLAADWECTESLRFDQDALRAEMLREGHELLARGGF